MGSENTDNVKTLFRDVLKDRMDNDQHYLESFNKYIQTNHPDMELIDRKNIDNLDTKYINIEKQFLISNYNKKYQDQLTLKEKLLGMDNMQRVEFIKDIKYKNREDFNKAWGKYDLNECFNNPSQCGITDDVFNIINDSSLGSTKISEHVFDHLFIKYGVENEEFKTRILSDSIISSNTGSEDQSGGFIRKKLRKRFRLKPI